VLSGTFEDTYKEYKSRIIKNKSLPPHISPRSLIYLKIINKSKEILPLSN